jgi:2-methylisocitrate lyase-like PEP mutase family enzyme
VENSGVSVADVRARFRELHARERLFVMPNPWDVGSAMLLESLGFEALATTSAGFALAIGKRDQTVTRDELVEHVGRLATATALPLNVDSERLYPDEPGGVAETVRLLTDAGAAGCSIEDYDPGRGQIDDVGVAAERVGVAAEAARGTLVLTARAENYLYGLGDLDNTLSRLIAYRDAGADVVYAPGLTDLGDIRRLVEAVGVPVNVLALRTGPSIGELESVGVRRVSTGSGLARAAYGAFVAAAEELRDSGTSEYAARNLSSDRADAMLER